MKQLIQKLTDTCSPSGYEDAISEMILAEIKPLADEIRVDALGNIIARKGTVATKGKRIMIAAHMDEIGLIATYIDGNGFVRFTAIGPISNCLAGGRVRFTNGVQGVIGSEKQNQANGSLPVDKLFIDVGATAQSNCPVRMGEVATFERPFVEIGRRLVAKSLDNRAGVAVAIETLRKLGPGPNEVHFVFTAQQEVGMRGATVSAFGVDPEVGLAIDATPAGDTPNSPRREIALGKGPAIKVKDNQMLASPRVIAWMESAAQEANIPVQREILVDGNTDALTIQLTRSGVLTGGLALPCRYVHSPSEMMDYSDVENAVELLTAILNTPINLG